MLNRKLKYLNFFVLFLIIVIIGKVISLDNSVQVNEPTAGSEKTQTQQNYLEEIKKNSDGVKFSETSDGLRAEFSEINNKISYYDNTGQQRFLEGALPSNQNFGKGFVEFNKNGEIINADFSIESSSSKNQKIYFKNIEAEITGGSRVNINNENLDIKLPDGSKISNDPKVIDEKNPSKAVVTYSGKNVEFNTPNGKWTLNNGEVSYNGKNYEVKPEKFAEVNGIEIKPEKESTNLYFDGKEKKDGKALVFDINNKEVSFYSGDVSHKGKNELVFKEGNSIISLEEGESVKVTLGEGSTMTFAKNKANIRGFGRVEFNIKSFSGGFMIENGKLMFLPSRGQSISGSEESPIKNINFNGQEVNFNPNGFYLGKKEDSGIIMNPENPKTGRGFAYDGKFVVIAPNQKIAGEVLKKANELHGSLKNIFGKEEGLKPTIITVFSGRTNKIISRPADLNLDSNRLWLTISDEGQVEKLLKPELARSYYVNQNPEASRLAAESIANLFIDEESKKELNAITGYIAENRNYNLKELLDESGSIASKYVLSNTADSAIAFSLKNFLDKKNPDSFYNFISDGQKIGWDNALRKYYRIQSIEQLNNEWRNYVLMNPEIYNPDLPQRNLNLVSDPFSSLVPENLEKPSFTSSKDVTVVASGGRKYAEYLKDIYPNVVSEISKEWLGKMIPPASLGRTMIHFELSNNNRGGSFSTPIGTEDDLKINKIWIVSKPNEVLSNFKHETAHIIFENLPPWASGGIAVSYDTEESKNIRKEWIQRNLNNLPDIEKVLNARIISPQNIGYYAISESLTNYLVENGGKNRFVEFAKYAKIYGVDNSLKSYYNINSVRELEERWKSWLSSTK